MYYVIRPTYKDRRTTKHLLAFAYIKKSISNKKLHHKFFQKQFQIDIGKEFQGNPLPKQDLLIQYLWNLYMEWLLKLGQAQNIILDIFQYLILKLNRVK